MEVAIAYYYVEYFVYHVLIIVNSRFIKKIALLMDINLICMCDIYMATKYFEEFKLNSLYIFQKQIHTNNRLQ